MPKLIFPILLLGLFLIADFSYSQQVQTPSSEEDITNALTGGVPMGRWKEGLLFGFLCLRYKN